MNESDSSSPERFVGIDVSQDQLDVCLLPGEEPRRFANDSAGREELLAWLQPRRPASIVSTAVRVSQLADDLVEVTPLD